MDQSTLQCASVSVGGDAAAKEPSREPATLMLVQWRRVQQLHVKILERNCALQFLIAWKTVLEWAPQRRREAFFEAMREEVLVAKHRYEAAEQGLTKVTGILLCCHGTSSVMLALQLWKSTAKFSRQCQKFACLACQSSFRLYIKRVLLEWISETHRSLFKRGHACPHKLSQGSEAMEESEFALGGSREEAGCPSVTKSSTALEPSHIPLAETPARLARCRSTPLDCFAPRPPSPASRHPTPTKCKPSGACSPRSFQPPLRQPLANLVGHGNSTPGSVAEDGEHKRLKGPARFFYDTSSYTGCARFGGPEVIDKENRIIGQRLQILKSAPSNPTGASTQASGRCRPSPPR